MVVLCEWNGCRYVPTGANAEMMDVNLIIGKQCDQLGLRGKLRKTRLSLRASEKNRLKGKGKLKLNLKWKYKKVHT